MKVAVIGVGRIGAFHAGLLCEHPDVDTLIVADVDRERARAVATDLGAQPSGPEDAIAAAPDAVLVTVPTAAHAEVVHACLDAGIPTFCEKPLAKGLAETRAIVERVESSGARLQVGFQRRFDAGYREAHRLVDGGELGRLYLVRLAGHDPAPPHEDYIPLSGGIFQDLHIHDLDILRFVTGDEVAEVYATGAVLGAEMFAKYGDVDNAAAVLTLRGGALAVMTGARHNPRGYDVRMELLGSGDNVSVGLDSRMAIRSVEPDVPPPAGPAYVFFIERFGAAYRAELSHFLDFARGRATNPCTARDALEAYRIALACDRSRAEHRPVRLEEIA